jgi:hypothetical protein
MHHPFDHRRAANRATLFGLGLIYALTATQLAMAQSSSPFMTGATSLQTKGRTLLAAATRVQEALPHAQIRAFAMVRTMGLVPDVSLLVDPCRGHIRWKAGDARRSP